VWDNVTRAQTESAPGPLPSQRLTVEEVDRIGHHQHTTTDATWWRKAGLWAIDTSNANSSLSAVPWMKRSSADLCLVQELKVLGSSGMRSCRSKADKAGWLMHHTEAHRTAANKASGGVAVCARNGIGSSPCTVELVPEIFQHRLAFAHVAGVSKGGMHAGSIWLRHTEGASEANLAILQVAANAIGLIKGPWVLGGDWNMSPEELRRTGFLGLVKAFIVAVPTPTCHASTYDYFVVPLFWRHAVFGVQRIDDAGFKPHWPSRLLVRGDARRKSGTQAGETDHHTRCSALWPQAHGNGLLWLW